MSGKILLFGFDSLMNVLALEAAVKPFGVELVPVARRDYHKTLGVGCVCAGKMEGNAEGAVKREAEFKKREKRRQTFLARKWRTSKNNNEYLKLHNMVLVLFYNPNNRKWKYSIDGKFCHQMYATRDEVLNALFDEFDKMR